MLFAELAYTAEQQALEPSQYLAPFLHILESPCSGTVTGERTENRGVIFCSSRGFIISKILDFGEFEADFYDI